MKNAKKVSLILCVLIVACAMLGCKKEPALNWEWRVNGDEDSGGSSTISMKEEVIQHGIVGYSFSGNITNKYEYGFVNVKIVPDDAALEKLKKCTGFSFKILGDGDRYAVKILTSDVQDYAYYEYVFETVKDQPITVVVPIGYLMQPSWGKSIGMSINTSLAQMIEFQTTRNGSPGPFSFKLWDVKLYSKGVPKLTSAEKKANEDAVKAAAEALAKAPPKTVGGNLGAMELILVDNFQYGEGYQCILTDNRLFNGHQISAGETFVLKITYSTSRDLEDVVQVGLVDPSPAANYWKALSWNSNAKDGDPDGMQTIKQSKAGETVTAEITLKTTESATGTSNACNALVFQTKGEGVQGTKGSGKMKPVTFNVTEFVFSQQ